jgi:hypothetical protein
MRLLTFVQASRRRGWAAVRCGAVAALLGLAGACGGSTTTQTVVPRPKTTTPAGKIISAATLKPGQSIPASAGRPVLTMTGKISATNQAGAIAFDQSTVERLGVEQVRLYEPWVKADLEFRGVWLQDLLAVAGVSADATRVHIVALDDYAVDLTLADVRAGGIMLAVRDGGGALLPIDQGGPTRIVFMAGVKAGANADQWVWSIKTIDVQ